MSELKTCQDFLDVDIDWSIFASKFPGTADSIEEAMVAFAKHHVIGALKKASEEAKVMKENDYGTEVNSDSPTIIRDYQESFSITQYGHGDSTTSKFSVDKSSILLCYSDKEIENG